MAVFVAVISTVLLLVAALAVDLGQQRVGRRDMQALADVVALDMARLLQGRTTAELLADPAWSEQLADSVARNPDTLGSPPDVEVEPGRLDPMTGAFSATSGTAVPTAVRVTASTDVEFSIMPGEGGASRAAVAAAEPQACLRLGSTLLDLQSGNSALLNAVLGGVLGGAVGLSAVSYQGLATSEVRLSDLAVALGAGSATQLLGTSVSLGTFFAAVADVLRADGSTEEADVVDATLLGVLGAGVGLAPVAVGHLLALAPGDESALGASVDALSLITTSAFVANGQNALSVPALALGVPGVGTATATVQVVEPPKLACGSARAETSQVRVTLSLPGSVVGVVNANVTTVLNLGNASGAITGLDCTDGAATSLQVALDPPSVLSLATSLSIDLLGFPPLATVAVPGTVPTRGAASTYDLELPLRYDVPLTSTAGTGTLGLPNLTAAQLSVLGIDLTGLLFLPVRATVLGLVNTLLDGVEGLLLGPVSSALGLRLGNADMFGVRTADCANPRLVG